MGTTIKKMLIEDIGWIYEKDGEIRQFTVNGEMASITWYGQNKRTFSGKYVICIEYN